MQHGDSILKTETERYSVVVSSDPGSGRVTMTVQSKIGAGLRVTHKSYNLILADGRIRPDQPITENAARLIVKNFQKCGETEAFDVPEEALRDAALASEKKTAEPSTPSVRHVKTEAEQTFTATGDKLPFHWPIFKKYQETGFGSIIRATMTNHQVCASRCPYRSTIARNKSDRISLEEAQAFVEKLYVRQAAFNRASFSTYNDAYKAITGADIRLRGLILSGGGQPNLWPHFERFVRWLSGMDIDLGLITNGFPPHVDESVYRHFKWIRISITPADASPFYPEGCFEKQYLPATIVNNPQVTVGFSYVYGPWTTPDILVRMQRAADAFGFTYCRVLTDCNLTRAAQIRAHQALAETLFKLGMIDDKGVPRGKLFHQLKYHGRPEEAATLWDSGQCYLQVYNVFWDTTGHDAHGASFCYPCDSVTVLAEQSSDGSVSASERRFCPEKWGTVRNTDVARLFTEPVRPFFDPRKLCSSCLFMKNNASVKALLQRKDFSDIPSSPPPHVNFP